MVLGAIACWSVFPPAGASAAAMARPADAFVESVGVNVHLGYSNTVYNNFSAVRAAIDKLGVRHIRDGVGLGRTDVYSRFRTLAGDGIGLDIIVGEPIERWGVGSLDQQLNMIESEFSSAVVSLEGPNEYDAQGDANWVANLRDYQRRLWEGAHARPKLAALPILGPSFATASGPAEAGDLSAWTNEGNIHPYPGGEQPDLDSHMQSELALAAKSTGSEPVQATETGYHNAVNTTNGHRPASERAAGIYTPRLFLDDFRRGITRTYDYELVDVGNDTSRTDPGQNFGLLRNDFSEKPSFVALKNLIALLEDPGPSFVPGGLSYSLQGAPSTARQVLLQKRDGSFYLALWNQASVWDTTKLVDLDPADAQVTLQFGQPIERAEVFQPNASVAPLAAYGNPSSIPISLSERVTLVKLVPSSAPAPAPEPEPEAQREPESVPTPEPTPEPESTPTPEPEPVVESEPAQPKPTTHKGHETIQHGKQQTRRTLLRVVRSGCRGRACPLPGAELHKARALLRLVPSRKVAHASSTEDAARLAAWLHARARLIRRSALRIGDWKVANRGVRFSAIQAVLGFYRTAGTSLRSSARIS